MSWEREKERGRSPCVMILPPVKSHLRPSSMLRAPQLSSPIIKIIIPISSSLRGSSSSPRTSSPSPTCCQWARVAAWNPMFSQFSQFRSPPSVHFTLSRHCGSNFLWNFFQSSRLFAQMIFLPGPTYLRLLVKPLQTKTLSNEALGLFSYLISNSYNKHLSYQNYI